MNYIGIRGYISNHRDLIPYIIGNTINYIILKKTDPDQNTMNKWINEITENENIIHEISLDNIYFESFGDTVKTFVALLLGCDQTYLYNDYYKDHILIDLSNFKYEVYDEFPSDIIIVDNKTLITNMLKKGNPDYQMSKFYITLRDFILYFGHDVMKRFLGVDVWIKSLNASGNLFTNIFDDKKYKFFKDVKTSSEITYIKEHNGVIIKINNKDVKRKKSMDILSSDKRYDYLIEIPSNIYDIYNQIITISNKILKYGEEESNNDSKE